MDIVLWVIAGLLAAAFLAAGAMKVMQSKEKLAASGMGWTDDFSQGMVKTIGLLEVLAAVGLILPAVLGIVPVLVPLAALGLAGLMVGAAITHGRRKETPMVAINVVLLILAAVVAWGRFGPYAFTS
ncbi:DoxX family protein [Arthrobacter sp. D1-29]